MFDQLLFTLDEASGIATATLNRPAALNAINQRTLDDFDRLWAHVKADDGIRAVIVRAHPESRAFTSGADVQGGPDAMTRNPNMFANRAAVDYLSPRAHGVWKPVIVAVHGICAGAGLLLVNDADIVLCSDDAQFFDPHLAIGIPSAIGPIGMAHRVNLGEVLRYTLLSNAERMGAGTALRIGLVTEVTTREALWPRADALAAIVAGYDSIAVQGTLRAIWEGLDIGRKAALERAPLYSEAARTTATGSTLRPPPVKRPPHSVR